MRPSDALSPDELERYSRHLALPEVGLAGQERLKRAKVAVVGTGGLGSPLAMYLAAAGVGTIALVDFDAVSASNLQRQILFDAADVGRPKVWQAKARLEALNPHVRVLGHEAALSAANAFALLEGCDVVADATDNFAARYVLNDACRLLGVPLVQASLYRFEGQLTVFAPDGPCYRCLYPQPPTAAPRCADAGVIGVLGGILGTLQANEVLKLLLGLGESLVGRLLLVEGLGPRFSEIAVPRDPACALCGEAPVVTALEDVGAIACDADDEIDARSLFDLDAPVLDVRDTLDGPASVPGARHVPFAELSGVLADLPLDRPVVVCCLSGGLSRQAVAILRGAGCERAVSLRGGLYAYHREAARRGTGL